MGCPRPIYPLANANNKAAIKTQIDCMIAYPATGTFIPSGLEWGWHVLSPGLPYTEGRSRATSTYSKTVKAMVLFTDGENDIGDDGNPNEFTLQRLQLCRSDGRQRQPPAFTTTSSAITALNTKTATLCTNVKRMARRATRATIFVST